MGFLATRLNSEKGEKNKPPSSPEEVTEHEVNYHRPD